MARKKGILLATASLVLTAVLCLCLYRWDNKYTHPGLQPISGMLFLSQEELADTPIHFLTREWELYPGVLLTPETVADYGGYRRFVDIGGMGNLTTGSATYRLTLVLPPEIQGYALELPEVFSACRLYVDGVSVLTLGNPETGEDGISNRMVLFPAGGTTELLLTATNHFGMYGGMTYPPAFGRAQDVLAMRDGRLLLHGGFLLLSMLGALLAISFRSSDGRWRRILFLLCCLCLAGITGYPILHTLFVTGYHPWYAFEMTGLYALLALTVLLQCDFYRLPRRLTVALVIPCLLGLGLAAVRAWGGPDSFLIPAFSVVSTLLKYYAAACLIGLSGWALWRKRECSASLLCASVSLAVFLVFDRIFPLYEPIFGGWFNELGGVVLTVALAVAMWVDAMQASRFRRDYAWTQAELQRRLEQQKEHYRQLTDQIETARETAHDLRHHARAIRTLAERGQTGGILSYLDDYEPHLREREVSTFSDHLTADAILCHYAAAAERLNATYDVRFVVPAELDFPDDELAILLSNLLENALEAISRQRTGSRTLYLRGDLSGGRLGLVVDNSFSGEIRQWNGHYLSGKREGFGLGLASVRAIAEKYGGLAEFSAEDTTFHASVMIPFPAAVL